MNNWVMCNDVVLGDTIEFVEAVFEGTHNKPKFLGQRKIVAKVTNESYGEITQQHTFSLVVINSEGVNALPEGKKIRRKGRNVYCLELKRQLWEDENKRAAVAAEKHERGSIARKIKENRLSGNW